MKKIMGIVLAMMVMLTGFAYAGDVNGGCLVISYEGGYVVIGAGDGQEMFGALASGYDNYEEQFDALWRVLGCIKPIATVEGELTSLKLEKNENGDTSVIMNETLVAEVIGHKCFVMTSWAGDKVSMGEGIIVNLWDAEGMTQSTGGLCPNCGEVDDGSEVHDNVISQFCDEGHTACMGDPIHTCEGCGQEYVCSKSNSHTVCAVCGKLWCDKSAGDHKAVECGHRGCEVYGDEEAHAKCGLCEGYLCDGADHIHAETEA